ncbi:hypothetical protein [Haloarchaeobius sp. DFWS5]|uniref:hypothetical protein n=1 Tax=Haloarchaeobius sp. DFWS5 TaxID=3446114 RepID=UPI003EB92A3A
MVLAPLDDIDARFRRYWRWLGAVLFVLVVLDLATTLLAAQAVGPEAEANPLVRWALHEGVVAVLALNVIAVAIVVVLFRALLESIRVTRPPYRAPFVALFEVWLVSLLLLGVFVFANNMSVVLFGTSLL